MDVKAEKSQELRAKLVDANTLTFILPISFICLLYTLMTCLPLAKIISNEINFLTVEDMDIERNLLQFTKILSSETMHWLFVCGMLSGSTAAVVYGVAYVDSTGKREPYVARFTRGVSRVCKSMMITCLWYFVIDFVILMASVFGISFVLLGCLGIDKSYSMQFNVAVIIVCVVLVRLSMYVRMVWQVGSVVSILEEKYNGEKCHPVKEGKRATAWALIISYVGMNGLCGYAVVVCILYVGGIVEKIAFGRVYAVLACVVTLMEVLTLSLLYNVRKSYNGEGMDEWNLLEGYLGEYLPIKDTGIQG